MASSATCIKDMHAAIEAGALPGQFAEGRTVYAFPTLAYEGARGARYLWTVRVRLLCDGEYVPIAPEMLARPSHPLVGCKAEITVESLRAGGKVRDVVPTYVSQGKNLGRKNATNCITQALRDALGHYTRHRKRGCTVGEEKAGLPPAGVPPAGAPPAGAPPVPEPPARPPPMLAKNAGASRDATLTPADFEAGVTVQRKLNGVRYVAAATPGGGLLRYSRTGADYPGSEQIGAGLRPMLAAAPPIRPGEYGTPPDASTPEAARVLAAYGALPGSAGPAPYLDGELYLHGRSLNWISGQARRDDDGGELQFHVFDVFFPAALAAGHDMQSRHRQAYLDAFFAASRGLEHAHVARVESFAAEGPPALDALAKRFLAEGYEGAVVRRDGAGYQYGYSNYHSAGLLKVKPKYDAEFPVVGFTQGSRGRDVGALIWICAVPGRPGTTFHVTPKDMEYKTRYALYKCLGETVEGGSTRFERDIKGLPLTVEYAELSSKTGKPLQARALAFRTYEGGPEKDPIRRLLAECA